MSKKVRLILISLRDYVERKFNANLSKCAGSFVSVDTGNILFQSSMYKMAKNENYKVLNIDGVDTLVKVFAKERSFK